ncbi:MAG: branched-chain amino acid ABC transporter permease, partial [Burkholderiales bacterium]|nr:branched-chain amino acid ABC transporter permease [Burkholderiales bacterium]
LVAAGVEQLVGTPVARALGMPKIPALFGVVFILKQPYLLPSALIYALLIYILPVLGTARLTASIANRVSAWLYRSLWISAVTHLVVLYAVLHVWSDVSDYRLLVVRLSLIAIIVTLSLNI